jgi:hypothetical protein
MLQDQGLTPGRIHACAKRMKAFYRINGLERKLPYALPRRVVYKDRAPQLEMQLGRCWLVDQSAFAE